MKKYQSFGFIASVVLSVGLFGFILADGSLSLNQTDSSAMVSASGLIGHIEVIHTDSEGNIKNYLQTDNGIMHKGVNCTMVRLFGASTAATHCNGAQTNTFNYIGLNSADISTEGTTLASNQTGSPVLTNGLGPAVADSVTITDAACTSGTGCDSTGVVRIAKTFTATGGTTNVFGAMLLNDTNNYALFAAKDFNTGGTSITLNTNDALTVNWDISVVGGGALQ